MQNHVNLLRRSTRGVYKAFRPRERKRFRRRYLLEGCHHTCVAHGTFCRHETASGTRDLRAVHARTVPMLAGFVHRVRFMFPRYTTVYRRMSVVVCPSARCSDRPLCLKLSHLSTRTRTESTARKFGEQYRARVCRCSQQPTNFMAGAKRRCDARCGW